MKTPSSFTRTALLLLLISMPPASFTSCKSRAVRETVGKATGSQWSKWQESNQKEEAQKRQEELRRQTMTPEQRQIVDKINESFQRNK